MGYRHFDTAHMYGNEAELGEALVRWITDGRGSREDLWVTTKVGFPSVLYDLDYLAPWQGYLLDPTVDAAGGLLAEFAGSLERLRLDHVDLLLMHFPGHPNGEPEVNRRKRSEMWAAMEQIHAEGRARCIGVSNFSERHFEEILVSCTVRPHVNQVEMGPYLAQEPLRQFCEKEGIVLVAHSPFSHDGRYLCADPTVAELASARGVSPTQLVLRWLYQRGAAAIPGTTSVERARENLEALQCTELSASEMATLSALDCSWRTVPGPDIP